MNILSLINTEPNFKQKRDNYDGSLDSLAKDIQRSSEDVTFLDTYFRLEAKNVSTKIKMLNKIKNVYGLEATTPPTNNDNPTFWDKVKAVLLKILNVIWQIISFIPRMIIKFINYLRGKKDIDTNNPNIDQTKYTLYERLDESGRRIREWVPNDVMDDIVRANNADYVTKMNNSNKAKAAHQHDLDIKESARLSKDTISGQYRKYCDEILKVYNASAQSICSRAAVEENGEAQCKKMLREITDKTKKDVEKTGDVYVSKLRTINGYEAKFASAIHAMTEHLLIKIDNSYDNWDANLYNSVMNAKKNPSENKLVVDHFKESIKVAGKILDKFIPSKDAKNFINNALKVQRGGFADSFVNTNMTKCIIDIKNKIVNGSGKLYVPVPEWEFSGVQLMNTDAIKVFKRMVDKNDDGDNDVLNAASKKFQDNYGGGHDSISDGILFESAEKYVEMCSLCHMVGIKEVSTIRNLSELAPYYTDKKLLMVSNEIKRLETLFKSEKKEIEDFLKTQENFKSSRVNRERAHSMAQYHKAMIQGAHKLIQTLQNDVSTMFFIMEELQG